MGQKKSSRQSLQVPVSPFVTDQERSRFACRDQLVLGVGAVGRQPWRTGAVHWSDVNSAMHLPLLGPQTLREGQDAGLGVPVSSPRTEKLPGPFIHVSVFTPGKGLRQK